MLKSHFFGEMAEWSNAPDSKSGIRLYRIVGSNPTLSANNLYPLPISHYIRHHQPSVSMRVLMILTSSSGHFIWLHTPLFLHALGTQGGTLLRDFYFCVPLMAKLRSIDISKLPDGFHADENGLYLFVRGNSRTWVYRGTVNGKRIKRGLGSAKTVSLAQARQKFWILRPTELRK